MFDAVKDATREDLELSHRYALALLDKQAREMTGLRAKLEKLAAEWRGRVPESYDRVNEYAVGRGQVHDACADELEAVLKGAPVTAAGGV